MTLAEATSSSADPSSSSTLIAPAHGPRISTFLSDDERFDAEEEDEPTRSLKRARKPNGLGAVRADESVGSSTNPTSTPTKKRKIKIPNANGSAANGKDVGNGSGVGGAGARRKEAERLFELRQQLPFYQGRKMILDEIMAHDTTIILGETGCGKSTQLPQLLRSHPISTSRYSPSSSSASLQNPRHTPHSRYSAGPSIAITQPRRLPAIALASRVAAESGSLLGGEVGYSVRFEEMTSRQTRVKFMTEGVLMRELANADPTSKRKRLDNGSGPADQSKVNGDHPQQTNGNADEGAESGSGSEDEEETSAPAEGDDTEGPQQGLNLLLKYDIIIIDEAHERTLNTDFLCGALKKVQRIRKEMVQQQKLDVEQKGKCRERGVGGVKELKLVIMSATLDPSKFQKFFDTGRDALLVKGRMYEVLTRHVANPVDDFIEAAARQVLGIHCAPNNEGDVLVFMPGSDEIENCVELLKRVGKQLPPNHKQLQVLPLYSALPPTAQAKIFAPPSPNSRRVIVATNIAETSLTIPGVAFVVDTGFKKEKEYIFRPSGAIEQLKKKGISKAAAWQRTGRAGRERAGLCFRLFTEEVFDKMPEFDAPEIQRCNLSSAVLQLIAMGQNPFEFEYIDDPGRDAIAAAFQTLAGLSALSSPTTITPLGLEMLRFPLDPPHARILIASFELGCANEVIDILSLINAGGHVFVDKPNERDQAVQMRAKFVHRDGDHLTGLNVFRAYLAIKENKSYANANAKSSSSASASKAKEGQGQSVLAWCKDNHVNGKTLAQALKVRNQLRDLCERSERDWRKSCGSDTSGVMKAMLQGLFMNTAVIQADGSYRQTAGTLTVKIHPSSVLMSKKVPAIMYDELTITTAFYARNVSTFEQAWLLEIPWFAKAGGGIAAPVSLSRASM